MFIIKNHSVSLTLFLLIVTVFVLTPAVSATSHASGGVSRRRDHATLKRFVKKRAVAPAPSSTPSPSVDSNLVGGFPLVNGAAPDPAAETGTANVTSISSSSTSSSTETSTSVSSSSTTSSVTEPLTTTTTSATNTTSTSSTSLSSSSSTSTSSQTSQTSTSTSAVETPASTSSTQVIKTETQTQTAPLSEETSPPAAPTSGLSGGKTALITILIVVAASVGGFAILWTVFRKWKLGRSSKFDQRLQPISWEPTVDDDIIPHRPGSDAASIRSHENRSGYGATSNLSQGLDHDFTAGPAHLAPVGGYADLTRGPSPQPSMHEALSRGPSLTRPNYDASVPLHHQNSYGVQDTHGRY